MKSGQLTLFDMSVPTIPDVIISPEDYDHIIVAFSGGKDSFACLLYLFDLGFPLSKLELWHHDVDGEGPNFMDWPCTRDYCRAVAQTFGIPIYNSWKVGGFVSEMLRENTPTAPTRFETPDGIRETGGKGPLGYRRKFPQISACLSTRWCSSYLKIGVCQSAIAGQERFNGKRILLVTGERAEESANRACYAQLEPHKSTTKQRHVDQWRPVHGWPAETVWEIMERYCVNPHPAYRLGWGRVSCAACIFGSPCQWCSLNTINPAQVQKIANYEKEFGVTINRTYSVPEMVAKGKPYASMAPDDIRAALSEKFEESVILPPGTWKLPTGAFGENAGPT